MQRPIKLRAWVMGKPSNKGQMIQVGGLVGMPLGGAVTEEYKFDETDWWGNYELIQYIGLKDKDGKEIYEGDIIQWWNKINKPQVVEATDGGWNPFIDDCTTDHSYHYEVIGNIYVNPGLLKGEECERLER